jgi:uncharacterized protein YutE (UPF0331/DUF86 family)
MTAIELKKSLIHRIAEIDDGAFLRVIEKIIADYRYFCLKIEPWIYKQEK